MTGSGGRPEECAVHRARTGAVVGAASLLALAVLPADPQRPAPAAAPAASRIRWGPCPGQPVPDGMRCGSLAVPLDHADPAKGTIDLALASLPAGGPRERRLGSLLLNFGGPGASGVEGLAADAKAFADLGERYDLVSFDPRGVGHSAPVTCGGSMAPDPGAARGDAAAQLAALRAVAERCERASGRVLPYIGTVHVSRDMDLIRRALGEAKLNYLGFSYGTRLGAVYAAQYPHRVGRMVLDGVDTLVETLTEQALVSAEGQQQALENFLAWCTRRAEGCVYGTNARAAKEHADSLVAYLDVHPLVDADGTAFTGQHAVTAIAAALYSRTSWPALADALARVERHDDPTGLLRLANPAEELPADRAAEPGAPDAEPVPVPADNTEAAMAAVNCADDPDRGSDRAAPTAVERRIAGLRDRFRQASRIFGPRQLGTVLACYGRPAGTDFLRRIDHPGAPRMLLIGTRGDPATPYRWTEETAQRLGSAVVLDYKGDGHTAYTASECVRAYADAFLMDGALASGTRSCPGVE
ncbi:alpha/beta fold hydrolase [Streptomyces sp. KD18]|nr:alpha/beta fold hydrolase [Streptomyces sp. KD18]